LYGAGATFPLTRLLDVNGASILRDPDLATKDVRRAIVKGE
jgi:hypothetical protein